LGLEPRIYIIINPDRSDLHKIADVSPLKLIDSLKMLALKKDFKGKCPICRDWE
jgi:hypothetical protein